MTRHFLAGEAQPRFDGARIDVIRTIGALAVDDGCSFVVVCGDAFESNQVSRHVILRAFEAMGATPQIPFYLLPGNHDPLDIDIAGMSDGTLIREFAALVEHHLFGCLLCRLKRQRLAGHPPLGVFDVDQILVPKFELVAALSEDPACAGPGDLWVTAGPESLVVLVRSVSNEAVVVVPVITDIEMADDECTVIPADLSPLGMAISAYRRLGVNIPARALDRRIVPMRTVEMLDLSGIDGAFTGLPIEGHGDPRLEVRQWLTDQLLILRTQVT